MGMLRLAVPLAALGAVGPALAVDSPRLGAVAEACGIAMEVEAPWYVNAFPENGPECLNIMSMEDGMISGEVALSPAPLPEADFRAATEGGPALQAMLDHLHDLGLGKGGSPFAAPGGLLVASTVPSADDGVIDSHILRGAIKTRDGLFALVGSVAAGQGEPQRLERMLRSVAPWSGRNRFRSPLVELSFPDQASAQLEGEGTFSIALSGSDGSPDASLELTKGDDTPISAFEGPVQGATLGGCPVKEAMLVSSAPQSPLGGCQVPLATFEGETDSGRKFTARAWQVGALGARHLLVASSYHDALPGNAAALEDTLKSIRLNCKAD